MRFVELKSQAQLDLQSLHRVRSRLVNARRALINQLRAILLERGHVVAKGPSRLDKALDTMLADADFELTDRSRALLGIQPPAGHADGHALAAQRMAAILHGNPSALSATAPPPAARSKGPRAWAAVRERHACAVAGG